MRTSALPRFLSATLLAMTAACSGGSGTSTPNDAVTPASSSGVGGSGNCLRDGQCHATKIADHLVDPREITWADGDVWATSKNVLVRVRGSNIEQFDSEGTGDGIAVVQGNVFWTVDSSLERISPDGDVTVIDSAEDEYDLDRPTDVIARSGRVYYRKGTTMYVIDPQESLLYGTKARVLGGRLTSTSTVDEDGTVFWAKHDEQTGPLRITKGDDDSTVLATLEHTSVAYASATTTSHVFIADGDRRVIVAVPKDGGDAFVVSDDGGDTYAIAADSDGVYWASRQGINYAAPDGTGARRLIDVDFGFVGRVAVSPTAIYWTNPDEGTIYEMTK